MTMPKIDITDEEKKDIEIWSLHKKLATLTAQRDKAVKALRLAERLLLFNDDHDGAARIESVIKELTGGNNG